MSLSCARTVNDVGRRVGSPSLPSAVVQSQHLMVRSSLPERRNRLAGLCGSATAPTGSVWPTPRPTQASLRVRSTDTDADASAHHHGPEGVNGAGQSVQAKRNGPVGVGRPLPQADVVVFRPRRQMRACSSYRRSRCKVCENDGSQRSAQGRVQWGGPYRRRCCGGRARRRCGRTGARSCVWRRRRAGSARWWWRRRCGPRPARRTGGR